MPKTQINLEGWQDYRGNAAGSLLYVETSHQSATSSTKTARVFFTNPTTKPAPMA